VSGERAPREGSQFYSRTLDTIGALSGRHFAFFVPAKESGRALNWEDRSCAGDFHAKAHQRTRYDYLRERQSD
jgi:hypothetical protein